VINLCSERKTSREIGSIDVTPDAEAIAHSLTSEIFAEEMWLLHVEIWRRPSDHAVSHAVPENLSVEPGNLSVEHAVRIHALTKKKSSRCPSIQVQVPNTLRSYIQKCNR
jgi:hypothetical protein